MLVINPFFKATCDTIQRARRANVALELISKDDYETVCKRFSVDEAEGLLEVIVDNLDNPERVKAIVLDIVRIAKARSGV